MWAPRRSTHQQSASSNADFFLSGTATAYESATPLNKDGKWHVTPQTTAPYKTRVMVYRRIDPSKFDGTVGVEWLNVTGRRRRCGVAERPHADGPGGHGFCGGGRPGGGICGEAGSIAAKDGAGGIEQTDPARYGSLVHPGDSFSYSIFEQTGEALHPSAPTPGRSGAQARGHARGITVRLPPRHVHRRHPAPLRRASTTATSFTAGAATAPISQSPQASVTTPTPTYIRTDVHIQFSCSRPSLTSSGWGTWPPGDPTTVHPRMGNRRYRPRRHLRTPYSRNDNENGAADTEAFESMLKPSKDPIPGIIDCGAPINAGSHT